MANQNDPERQRLNDRTQASSNSQNSFNIVNQNPEASKQPKDENFWDMLKYNLCPKFGIFTVTFSLCLINIIAFIVVLFMSINSLRSDEFLGINTAKLSQAGAKNTYNIYHKYQVYRWVVPIFLHANFMHIFFNSVSLFWVGFMVERTVGPIRFFALYLLSGIGGFIFSSLCSDSIGVGASGAIFGLIGILIAHLILNWRAIVESGAFISILCVILMMVLISLSGNSHTDNWGHLGGVVCGTIFGFVLLNEAKGRAQGRSCKLTTAGYVTLFVFVSIFVTMITLFFTVRNPKRQI